ncbi:hypothetical protein U1872_19995 [Sphingomonas sp. RB3P16]|uniref:hypothetical protein n=1 Tax=Parasphingomonas frigoris TaxID=3096163 RepID=UPI002FC6767E
MAEHEDMAFLVARERQSRELAALPGDIAVQRAHLGIAEGYAARICLLKAQTA